MMRVLFAFIILLGSVYLGIQLHKDSGYVLIAIHHLRIETSVWVAIFAILLASLLTYLLLKLIIQILKVPGKILQWRKRSRWQKAENLTRKGLIEYNEGDWLKAKNHLTQAIPYSKTPLINYLMASQCAQKIGDNASWNRYLQEALDLPDAKLAVSLTKAQLELANQQWEQARATLNQLQAVAPKHPYVLKLIMHLDEATGDWQQLITLLPMLKRNPFISQKEFEIVQVRTYSQAIQALGIEDQDKLKPFFNALPKTMAHNPQLAAQYAQFLIQKNDYETAEVLLRHCLRKEFNAQLIELYGLIHGKQNELHFAESLLNNNDKSSDLYLCLGRLCLNQHLWGKAKYYLEESLELSPSPKTYFEMAKLYDKLNDTAHACINYKKGLSLATR